MRKKHVLIIMVIVLGIELLWFNWLLLGSISEGKSVMHSAAFSNKQLEVEQICELVSSPPYTNGYMTYEELMRILCGYVERMDKATYTYAAVFNSKLEQVSASYSEMKHPYKASVDEAFIKAVSAHQRGSLTTETTTNTEQVRPLYLFYRWVTLGVSQEKFLVAVGVSDYSVERGVFDNFANIVTTLFMMSIPTCLSLGIAAYVVNDNNKTPKIDRNRKREDTNDSDDRCGGRDGD